MKKLWVIILLGGLVSHPMMAQNKTVDSLSQVLLNTKQDTQRCVLYYEIVKAYYANAQLDELMAYLHEKQGEIGQMLKATRTEREKWKILQHLGLMFYTEALSNYRLTDLDKAWIKADTALAIFSKIDDHQFMAAMYNVCGILCQYQSLPDSSLYYYRKCFETAALIPDTGLMVKASYNQAGILKNLQQYGEAIKLYQQVGTLGHTSKRKMAIGDSHKGLGDVYYYTSRYNKAIEEYTTAINIFESINDLHGLNNALANIANIYKEQGEYKAALRNYRRSIEICLSQKNQKTEANTYLSIGAVYSEMGLIDSSKYYYRKGLKLHHTINYLPGIAMGYANLGNKLVETDSIKQGYQLLEKSVSLYRELEDNYNLVMVLVNLANAELQISQIDRAEQHAKEAYNKSMTLGIPEGILQSSGIVAKVLNKKGDYKLAFQYLEINKNYQDSLRNKEIRNNAIRSDLEMEYQRKTFKDSIENERERYLQELNYQATITDEKEKRNLLFFLALGGLVLALGFYSRFRYISRSKKILQKEKDRSENLLLNILPAEVAEELKERGESEARDFDDVTVLFTDFVSFTQTAEKLTAKELVSEINNCFKAFDGIIEKYNIEKIKTIGDAYMAAGGLHIPRNSEPGDVVKAAIEMQAFMLQRKAERSSQSLPSFDMRVGIHTGPVVAGIVGIKKFQYDIWGDTVNTASRMESHGEVGKVNISEDTYQLIKSDPDFSFESRGKMEVKGKGEMEMWFVNFKNQ